MSLWMTLGSLGLLALGTSIAPSLEALRDRIALVPDRVWMAATALLALVLGVLVERFVCLALPLTQDESVYRFGADIIGSGRLYADSLPDREYYSNNLIVNDGKWYPQYFIGWLTLLAPFVKAGVPGLANPVYFGVSVPAVFLLLRPHGALAARLGALLFATAPLTVLAAGTSLSHTSTLMLLCWTAAIATRAGGAIHAGPLLAIAFCGAFFIRPTTALGVGGPFLLWWCGERVRERDWRSLGLFALPSALLAAVFLGVNHAQTGSATQVAYQRYLQFAAEEGYRFTSVRKAAVVANFRFEAWRMLAIPFEALYRLNIASFGWPFALGFALPALRTPSARVYVVSLVSMLGIHCMLDVTGMDLFGPVHFLEAVLPILVLVVLGMRELWRMDARWLVGTALASSMLAWPTFGLVRAQNMHLNAVAQQRVYALAEPLDNAVILVPDKGFVHRCQSDRVRIRHGFRPENPVDLDAPVLWLNAIDPERDRRFLAQHHPERQAWRLRWNARACEPTLRPVGPR